MDHTYSVVNILAALVGPTGCHPVRTTVRVQREMAPIYVMEKARELKVMGNGFCGRLDVKVSSFEEMRVLVPVVIDGVDYCLGCELVNADTWVGTPGLFP